MACFSSMSPADCEEWVTRLGGVLTILPPNRFTVTNFSAEERSIGQHSFYSSVKLSTERTRWIFKIGMMSRYHARGCAFRHCYGQCIKIRIPFDEMEKQNEVGWFVSHANVNDYVEVKTVPDGIALIRAFKSFLDDYETKSAPNPPDFAYESVDVEE